MCELKTHTGLTTARAMCRPKGRPATRKRPGLGSTRDLDKIIAERIRNTRIPFVMQAQNPTPVHAAIFAVSRKRRGSGVWGRRAWGLVCARGHICCQTMLARAHLGMMAAGSGRTSALNSPAFLRLNCQRGLGVYGKSNGTLLQNIQVSK